MFNGWLRQLARLNLPLYKFENDRIKIVYAGYSCLKRNYCINLLLGKDYNQTFLGRRWFWNINRRNRLDKYDILISEISRITFKYFRQNNGYILPEFVGMKLNIDRPFCDIIRKDVSHFSETQRCIRKYSLTYEILSDRESFNTFIDKYYLPYISRRHGENARIHDLHQVWKSTPPPFILAIKEEGIIVAETIVRRCGDCLFALYMGIIDGRKEYLRHGVAGAIYYFCIIEGQKFGCKCLDIGSTPPFLNDGMTRFKLGLGAEFVPDFSQGVEYLWLGVNETSDAAKELLQSYPFMYLNKDQRLVKCGE